ncbi:MAG TPA: M3 family metallopeptidase, partial [Bacteroidales bacterium]|nr:M3 family metallopeptidase [Bacteroidales bacterium]
MRKIYNLFFVIGLLSLSMTGCKNEPAADMNNPFFSAYDTPYNVPPFDRIWAKDYMPAFEKGMEEGRADIEKIVNNPEEPSFENTIEAYDSSGKLLMDVSTVFFSQSSANTNDSLQKIEVDISPKLSAYQDEILLNKKLFQRIKSVYDSQDKFNPDPEQAFLLDNLYKSFVRNGANLSQQDQDTLKELNSKLSVLTVKFSQNVLAETNDYKMYVTKDDLAGLPESVIATAAETAKEDGHEGEWAFTTQRPSIFPFMTYSPRRDLRQKIFDAYINRGNNGNQYDNNKILEEIVSLRAKRAKLLGYKTHADYVLEVRMAGNPSNVFDLLDNLWSKAIPVAKGEVSEMQKIIDQEGGKFKLQPYDWWYYAEKLRKKKYDLNDSELRPYFKLDNVRDGLFTVANKLFGITITPIKDIPKPHPDARAYEVRDTDGSHLGVLYMDFHPRGSKQQGAWCGEYRSYHIVNNTAVTPVVTTVFNFTSPNGDQPALLSLEETSTMYHE